MAIRDLETQLPRDLYTLENENNPRASRRTKIAPKTILDQVYDQLSPDQKNLREIIADLRQEIITGGRGNITFPVTSVNGQQGAVQLSAKDVGLGRVDNTPDIEKPLSRPQRETIYEILKNYDFTENVKGLKELSDHLKDTSNPHSVTLDQINESGSVDRLIKDYLNKHNLSYDPNTHRDIRGSLANLWHIVDNLDDTQAEQIASILHTIDDHLKSMYSHQNIFDLKENLKNKAIYFTDTQNNDQLKYPTTHAVSEYVHDSIQAFSDTFPKITEWIDNIEVVDQRENLPDPSPKCYRSAYYIRYGEKAQSELAICKLDTTGTRYYWDYSPLGTLSKYDEEQFDITENGVHLNTTKVIQGIFTDRSQLQKILDDYMKDFYHKSEVDHILSTDAIKILPGTMDGTIRYYTNDDPSRMSDDIYVPGLKRVAFKEWITEHELYDQAVHERHILSRSIVTRHIRERAVTPEKIACPVGHILGNVNDTSGAAAVITLRDLADMIRPYL